MKIILKILLIFSILLIFTAELVKAQEMQSPQYKLEDSTIDVSPQDEASVAYTIGQSWGPLAGREFQKQGYVVRTGFEDGQEVGLNFTISQTSLFFEKLKPNKPVVVETDLSVQSHDIPYQIAAIEEGPLQSKNGSIIENTKCDNLRSICLPQKPAPWNVSSNYGFGYSFDKQDYQPFPDLKFHNKAAVVISTIDESPSSPTKIFFKTNIADQQADNNYQTVINFILAPLP